MPRVADAYVLLLIGEAETSQSYNHLIIQR